MKKKLFHILNERARRKKWEQEQRAEDMEYSQWNDPRRAKIYEQLSPLIEEDEK